MLNGININIDVQGFDNMIKNLHKHEHRLVVTRTKPEVLLILSRMGCDLHIHRDGTDINILLEGNLFYMFYSIEENLYKISILVADDRDHHRGYSTRIIVNLIFVFIFIFFNFFCRRRQTRIECGRNNIEYLR